LLGLEQFGEPDRIDAGTGMCAPIRNTTNARSRKVSALQIAELAGLAELRVAIYALPPSLPSGPGRFASRLSLPSPCLCLRACLCLHFVFRAALACFVRFLGVT